MAKPQRLPARRHNALAVRGFAALLALFVAAVATVLGGAGLFRSDPEVTTVLPAAAGLVRPETPVQYRGVRVGRLADVDPGIGGSRLTLRLESDKLVDIPGDVRVRLMPRTIFGDQYLDFTVPEAPNGTELVAGAEVPADDSRPTMQLYHAYTRLYQLVESLQPARLQTAFSALAEALRGRGNQLGSVLDDAAQLAGSPPFDNLGEHLDTFSALSADLAAAAPDAVQALDNAVALSGTIVRRKQAIGDLLGAGLALTDRSQRFVDENAQRIIRIVRATGPVAEVLGRYPHAVRDGVDALDAFLDGANRAFSTGFFKIRMAGTLDRPYPYSPADCPRYPGLDGPNCGTRPPEGPIGPVGGSPQELDAMRQLAPLLPTPPAAPPPSPDVLGLLLGPVVRGSEVVTP
ncbi:MCE family protein [Saccharopolyspora spinosa]|uniref:Virulence factor Mce-like protein n=1 Tax=Saccharopolyspora spinosa TaxID=60894 RepID=A0A2N3Y3L6_SACSN|nr:MCE family protein [Saccharopolyspora spinosa]PKW17515.1 virulence factor Mce-like protein [Saccharopolyspora spinosa]